MAAFVTSRAVVAGLTVVAALAATAAVAATTTTEETQEGAALRQAKLLAGVAVTAFFHFLGLRDRDADAFSAATAIMAATALAAGFYNYRVASPDPAGLRPGAQHQSAHS